MNNYLEQPLQGFVVYNPDLLGKRELIGQFVAHMPLLRSILDDLRKGGMPQHRLVIGGNGMGKTTWLRRLAYAIEDDPKLSTVWLPLTFPEEQYNVTRLSDFWLNCLDALEEALDRLGQVRETSTLYQSSPDPGDENEDVRARFASQLLIEQARKIKKRLILLVDNLDIVLARLKQDHWAIREMLSTEQEVLLIGTSARVMESTYQYEGAFYDFFHIHELKGLSAEKMCELLRTLSRLAKTPKVEKLLDGDPGRIRALHLLTGGNPRLIVLLHNVLASGGEGSVWADLARLLDQCTPCYKVRFEAFPVQAQQIVDAIALHWDPITAGSLAERLRMDVNKVSAQLNRLVQQGVVEKVAYYPSNKTGFQIGDRFFNIWYLMRAGRQARRRLEWLMDFLKLLSSQDQLSRQAEGYLHHACAFVREGNWIEAAKTARSFILESQFDEQAWVDMVAFFAEAVRAGHAADAVEFIDELGFGGRWRPLCEALTAIRENNCNYLRRVAPEVRYPANQLLEELWPGFN